MSDDLQVEKGTTSGQHFEIQFQESPDEKGKELLLLPDNIIELAESMGLLGRPLLERVKQGFEKAKEISEQLELPEPGGLLETQIRNMRTALNIAFLKKEREVYPERSLLEVLHSETQHPQEFINLMVFGEGLYYDSQGRLVNLEGYLRDYYRPLIEQGVSIRIESRPPKNVYSIASGLILPETEKTLADLERRGVSIPVLVIEYTKEDNKRRKEVPLLFSQQSLEEIGAAAIYLHIDKYGEPAESMIGINLTNPLRSVRSVGGKAIVEGVSKLVHEIDHAVFNFLHDSGIRQLYEEYKKTLEEKNYIELQIPRLTDPSKLEEAVRKKGELERKLLSLNSKIGEAEYINAVGESMVFEGLARKAERAFLEAQGKGLDKFLSVEIIEAIRFLLDYDSLFRQLYYFAVRYSVGEVLTAIASKRAPMEQLYTSDILDRAIARQSEVIRRLLRYFIANREAISEELREISTVGITPLGKDLAKQLLEEGLGKYATPFILGEEYFKLLKQIYEEVNKLTDAEVEERLKKFIETRPDLVKMVLERAQDIRKALVLLEGPLVRIRERYQEELNKLFE